VAPRTACILSVFLLACSPRPTFRAQLDHAAGLTEGSPVQVAGLHVANVKRVRLVDGNADVEFQLVEDHELTLHPDTCAVVANLEGRPTLVVDAGDDPGAFEGAIPQCRILPESMEELGQALGEGFRQLSEGLFEGIFGGMLPMPVAPGTMGSTPQVPRPQVPIPPMPQGMNQGMNQGANPTPANPGQILGQLFGNGGPPPCDAMRVTILEIRDEPANLHHPDGGVRVRFDFENDNLYSVSVGPRSRAIFMNEDRAALTPISLPGDTWFMRFDVPANGSATADVVFPATLRDHRVDAIEVRDVRREDNPLTACTLSVDDLEQP